MVMDLLPTPALPVTGSAVGAGSVRSYGFSRPLSPVLRAPRVQRCHHASVITGALNRGPPRFCDDRAVTSSEPHHPHSTADTATGTATRTGHGPAAARLKHLAKVIRRCADSFLHGGTCGFSWCSGRRRPAAPAHRRRLRPPDPAGQGHQVDKVDCKSVNAGQTRRTATLHCRGPAGQNAQQGLCGKATVEVTSEAEGRTFTEIVQPDSPRQLHSGQRRDRRVRPRRTP